MSTQNHIAIIGGGAAGFFAALSAKAANPAAQVVIYEKSNKVLAKVKVSGGGRCNVTHACFSPSELAKHYPRGGKQLKKAFGTFYTTDTVQWFQSRGVELKTESDNRMFPATDSSQTIIDCLQGEASKLGVEVRMHTGVQQLTPGSNSIELLLSDGKTVQANAVIVATGGSPKLAGFSWLSALGHAIESPVPSLFTFNLPGEKIRELMGVVAPNATVRIQGTKLASSGPLLITHWGMSGPAILRTSAFGARLLEERNYQFTALVSWLGETNEDVVREQVAEHIKAHPLQQVGNKNPFELPKRLWAFLLQKIEQDDSTPWTELGKKNGNRLINLLLNDAYQASGKTTFKEEFVTAGGVKLAEVDFKTMQSRVVPGLFFAGEVLDVDGVTGGFNFQAAWTTGFVAGRSAAAHTA